MLLKEKIDEALKAGKYLITISYKTNATKNDLQHFWITNNYPKEDLTKSLDHIKNDIIQKEILTDPSNKAHA